MTEQTKVGLDARGVSALLTILTEPTPATFMREVLMVYLDRLDEHPIDFEQAWAQAMRMIPKTLPERAAWKTVLRFTKPHFRESWDAQLVMRADALAA